MEKIHPLINIFMEKYIIDNKDEITWFRLYLKVGILFTTSSSEQMCYNMIIQGIYIVQIGVKIFCTTLCLNLPSTTAHQQTQSWALNFQPHISNMKPFFCQSNHLTIHAYKFSTLNNNNYFSRFTSFFSSISLQNFAMFCLVS